MDRRESGREGELVRVLGGVASGVRGKLTVECEISRWTDMRNAGLSDDMIEVDELVDFQRNEEGCDNDYLRLGKVIELMGRWHLKGTQTRICNGTSQSSQHIHILDGFFGSARIKSHHQYG